MRINLLRRALLALPLIVFCLGGALAQTPDPLPSWNDGGAKKSIIDFVDQGDEGGSPDFVPVAERIATFDNDGTLWSEQPIYFAVRLRSRSCVKALAAAASRVEDRASRLRPLLNGDLKSLSGGESAAERPCHHPCRYDHRGVRTTSSRTGSPSRAIRGSNAPTPSWSISRCSNCSPICARTASRPSSSPAAASSSCAPGPSRSMASRRSRSLALPASIKFEMRRTASRCCSSRPR